MQPNEEPLESFPSPKIQHQSKKKVHIDPFSQLQAQYLSENISFQKPQPEHNNEEEGEKSIFSAAEVQCERNEEGCLHQIFSPKGYQRKKYQGPYTARKFPFKLDPFQEKSVNAIESNQSVFVCAHTSAGKTAIAEYAIAKSLKSKNKVIYTSPIKTLSNQKFRELKKVFEDVGIITGDIKIDKSSSCLVMTTEILRNMIFNKDEALSETKWVIFDEAHYMKNKQRGAVWEETIIMMPPNIRFLFLSATIENPQQVAKWVTKLRKQPCHVVYTDYRPVPLEHYICPSGGQGIFMVLNGQGQFLENNFNRARENIKINEKNKIFGEKEKNKNIESDLMKVIKLIVKREMDPAIIFSFSKYNVQMNARTVVSKFDLTSQEQKKKIEQIFKTAISLVSEKDRLLPLITSMKQIISKGVGFHHGGLLPIIKEVIEILFHNGLIKVLFSTQTFSMGVNMPARTVVFTSIKKFDGEKLRFIDGGEYIQMAGRAGRRSIDEKGFVIIIADEKIEKKAGREMLQGKSENLVSNFHINYNTILNSHKLDHIDLNYMLERTFLQYQYEINLPLFTEQYEKKYKLYQQTKQQNEEDLEKFYELSLTEKQINKEIKNLIFTPSAVLPYLSIGRVVRVGSHEGGKDWGYGCIINFQKTNEKKKKKQERFVVDILVYIKKSEEDPQPTHYDDPNGELTVLLFTLDCIQQITTIKVDLPKNLKDKKKLTALWLTLQEFSRKELKNIEIKSQNSEVQEKRKKRQRILEQMSYFQHLQNKMDEFKKRKQLQTEIKNLSKNLSENAYKKLKKQKKYYLKLLKKMDFIEKGILTKKGTFACQISGKYEILLTQLIFQGFFNDLSPSEIAAILATVTCEEKNSKKREIIKTKKLQKKFTGMVEEGKKIYHIFKDCKVSIEEEEYVGGIKEDLVDLTYQWCSGADFSQIYEMVDMYEGNIVRSLRRLHEILLQIHNALQAIENTELADKFKEARLKVMKGMVKTVSLYTV